MMLSTQFRSVTASHSDFAIIKKPYICAMSYDEYAYPHQNQDAIQHPDLFKSKYFTEPACAELPKQDGKPHHSGIDRINSTPFGVIDIGIDGRDTNVCRVHAQDAK